MIYKKRYFFITIYRKHKKNNVIEINIFRSKCPVVITVPYVILLPSRVISFLLISFSINFYG